MIQTYVDAMGDLVIRVPQETLVNAAKFGPYFDRCAGEGIVLEVSEPDQFMTSIAAALQVEEEDGSTPIHHLLDAAVEYVSEQGEPGIQEAY